MERGRSRKKSRKPSRSSKSSGDLRIFAHADDPGLQYVLMPPPADGSSSEVGGLFRTEDHGHLVTIVGRGGTGKSILSLQLVSELVRNANEDGGPYAEDKWGPDRKHTAFYFTLESPHQELAVQAGRFSWGEHFRSAIADSTVLGESGSELCSEGIRIISAPTPTKDVAGLVQYIKQNIAKNLAEIGRVIAIVVDPFGGVDVTEDLRRGLLQLRDLCRSHRAFLFVLVENFLYSMHPWIEHFSETVIHLEHDPGGVPHRRLHIQKARHQRFYSGFHQFELHENKGFRLYPSLLAQSKGAHEELTHRRQSKQAKKGELLAPEAFFSPVIRSKLGMKKKEDLLGEGVAPGSVIFLMGPPGTFKQALATGFALSAPMPPEGTRPQHRKLTWLDPDKETDPELEHLGDARSLYITFKAEPDVVRRTQERFAPDDDKAINFLDSRDPTLTPEEVLFRVRRRLDQGANITRAVIWGLRRLRDMPRFAGEKAVQLLEALVTLLTSRQITSLLIDWPDIEMASQLPIVDLSQYIILTRVCHGKAWFEDMIESVERQANESGEDAWALGGNTPEAKRECGHSTNCAREHNARSSARLLRGLKKELWQEDVEHAALLRVQRKEQRFVRNEGVILSGTTLARGGTGLAIRRAEDVDLFEDIWNTAGISWEEDPGLVEFGTLSQLRTWAKT